MDSNIYSDFWGNNVPSQSLRSPLWKMGLLPLGLRGHPGVAQTDRQGPQKLQSPQHPPVSPAYGHSQYKVENLQGGAAKWITGAAGTPSGVTQKVSQASKGWRRGT
ncbi:hypothetical protein VULLAG_LOCUS22366 [Vulpes lagopus]